MKTVQKSRILLVAPTLNTFSRRLPLCFLLAIFCSSGGFTFADVRKPGIDGTEQSSYAAAETKRLKEEQKLREIEKQFRGWSRSLDQMPQMPGKNAGKIPVLPDVKDKTIDLGQ